MIFNATGVALTKADFDAVDAVSPGTGTACWEFMREGCRGFAMAMRGAGAYTAGRCSDVLQAADDMQGGCRVMWG